MKKTQNQTTIPETAPAIDEVVSSLVKVKLMIGCKGGQVRATELAQETATAHGADVRDISTSVKWLSKEYRSLIGGAYSRLRSAFNARTLPWEDGGYRVVPADRYQHLCDTVAECGAEFAKAGETIVAHWDEVIAEAKARLNGAFAKLDIPTSAQFLDGIRYDLTSDVVVAPADMRIAGLGEATIERIRSQAEAAYADRIQSAVGGMVADLTKMLTDLVGRIDKDKQKGTRYEGWTAWAKRTVALMRPLNFTNDARLNSMLDRVQKLADELDADAVRDDDKYRRKVKAEAVDALDLFGIK